MNTKRLNNIYVFIVAVSSLLFFFTSCKEKSMEGMIVFTQTTSDLQNINSVSGDFWRLVPNSQLVLFNPNKPKKQLEVLTEGFYSACSPQISFDGKSMLFSAQKKQNSVWQIWEMNLKNRKVKQITNTPQNCIDPTYLPDQRIVFSKAVSTNSITKSYELFTCNLDGTKMDQITFNPHNYFATTTLKDGRVLTISRELYPIKKDEQFLVLRPDGTKEELFYKSLKNNFIQSSGRETASGTIIFIESDTNKKKNLISIAYSRPLHSETNLSENIPGDFNSASPWKENDFLVSYRSSKNNHYAIFEFNTKNKALGQVIYKDNNYNIIDAVIIKKNQRPRNLPSEVNMSSKIGMLLCQDINFTDSLVSTSKAVKIEVLGINKSLGTVDVSNDGSFYLKIIADTPFRIQTIDVNNKVVNGPSSWMFMRPGERRGCVGCHEDPEQVPVNRQPLAVKKDPIVIPEQLKQVNNKKVH